MDTPAQTTRSTRSAEALRVAILGGGPAGAFCAIWLCRMAEESGNAIEVVVFDHKSFEKLGPAGCNMCAGVIPHSLVRSMKAIEMEVPERVVQRRLGGCYLETKGGSVDLPAPEGEWLYATFRGPGPLGVYPAADEGFDWLLLGEAQRRGARHESRLVADVSMPSGRRSAFEVKCRDGFRMEADIVVGAFGVNSNLGSVFERLGVGYRAPRTLRARQAEMPVDPDSLRHPMRDRMMIFAMGWPAIRYAAITPKRRHVTVTLIGENPGRPEMEAFLDSPVVRKHFPRNWSRPSNYCSCAPQLPVSAARNPTYDRLVIIGDAHTSRYLKNGIESSFYTARWAAEAIANNQTCYAALQKHYVDLCRRAYVRDNVFGKVLLRTHDLIARSAVVSRSHMVVARQEQIDASTNKPLTEILWGTFTGSMPYRKIVGKALAPRLQFRLGKVLLSSVLGSAELQRTIKPREVRGVHVEASGAGRVIVVGGGPAGTACAITLARGGRNGVPAADVVLLEEKQFGERQNQCAGVLSPPGAELIGGLLGGPVPASLLQRRIKGYALHGAGRSIYLDGDEFGESPSVLRRVELDRLLLQRSRESGVRVLQTRATDVEFTPDGVVVHTESGSVSGVGVVGAFALDDAMARAFSRSTGYRRPLALETLACKIHPGGLSFVEGLLNDCIQVFLPRRASIDFGALIPKGNHIVVIIAGARVGVADIDAFMALPEVRRLLPEGAPVQGYYKGAFPLGPARGLHGESYVVIGDAAGMVRPFKGKGINSALEGGRKCAEAILAHGFSREGLAAFVHSQRHLTGDAWYGRLVRRLVMLTSKRGLLDPIIEQARENGAMSRALFDCISGRTTYREVVLRAENLQWIPSAAWRCATWRGLKQESSGNDKGELQ